MQTATLGPVPQRVPAPRRRRAAGWVCVLLGVVVGLQGCSTLRDAWGFKEQMEVAGEFGRITGTIGTEGEPVGNLIVVLGRVEAEGPQGLIGVDTFIREVPGPFRFAVRPGRYRLGAYEDRNRNGLLDPGERTRDVRDGPLLELAAGGHVVDDIVLARDATSPSRLTKPMNVLELVARTPREQRFASLWAWSAEGELCRDLDDPTFGPEAGRDGLWKAMDFLQAERAGIYFMEPYDPDRVPILFVHGIAGYPQEFAALIDSLDRTRYQAWFYFYPSGFGLQGISRHLSTLLIRLEVRYGFDQFGIVAHSMGGLVARGAILEYAEAARHDGVRLFVSVSTPWGGDPRAEIVDRSPIAMPESFDDMKPDSAYLRWLFYQAPTDGEDGSDAPAKRLPRGVAYHMVVGYRLPGSASQSGDGRVSLASQARLEVQRSALSVRAFDETHTGILSAPETLQHINALIEDRFD